MPKKRFTTNRGGYGGASLRSYQQQQQQQQPPKTFRNQNLSPLETISQTSRTLRTLKRDGTFDRIRRRLIESILQNETLKTYAQFAVTASSRIMSLRMQQRENNGSNEEEEEKLRVDAATKMAIKRELEMDLSREVSHAAWNVLAERDGPVPREVQSEIFRERKMRFDRAEKRREKKKSEKRKNKSSKISGRKKTRRKSVDFDAGAA